MAMQFTASDSAIRLPCYALNESLSTLAKRWGRDSDVSVVPCENERTFWRRIRNQQPPVIVVGAEQSLLTNRVIAHANSTKHRPTIVALVESPDEALLTDCYQQGADRVVVTPFCSARIFRALLHTLLSRDDYYPPYLLNASIQTIKFGDSQVRLGKKPFDLAQYLFANFGEIIPKSRILRDIWGLDGQECVTRRIDVHMSLLRKELVLDGSLGWEIRVRRNKGYGLFQTRPCTK